LPGFEVLVAKRASECKGFLAHSDRSVVPPAFGRLVVLVDRPVQVDPAPGHVAIRLVDGPTITWAVPARSGGVDPLRWASGTRLQGPRSASPRPSASYRSVHRQGASSAEPGQTHSCSLTARYPHMLDMKVSPVRLCCRRVEVESFVHVEQEPPVRVDMRPEEGAKRPAVLGGDPLGPCGVFEDPLDEQGVDVDQGTL